MIAKVCTVTTIGFDGKLIDVECDSSKGLPGLQIVGLANKAIEEARERVRSAITNSNLDFPAKRITINLAPANLPKNGAGFDLPIAIAILIVSGQLRAKDIADSLFIGELALDGKVRPVRGVISAVETARSAGLQRTFVPISNLLQASLIDGIEIIGITNLSELFLHLKGERNIEANQTTEPPEQVPVSNLPTIDDIYGQDRAKRALLIAAAGHHNILFTGPPGAGKTMLAKALANLLPSLSIEEQIAVTKIHNLAGYGNEDIITRRPFRSPHHTASHISLIGGGATSRPGEISLAHLGVLFLDELPEYPRASLEALRQPLEDRLINISRSSGSVTYPAHFMLVATQNPCPCGFYDDPMRECGCTSTQLNSYQKRLSGPLLDRIDMVVSVGRVDHQHLLSGSTDKPRYAQAKNDVAEARNRQKARYNSSIYTNASISTHDISQKIPLAPDIKAFLAQASEKLQLTARSHFKIIKVARSIADLDNQPEITLAHVSEALQYRQG